MLGLVRLAHGKRTEVLPEEDWNILSSVVQEALRRAGRAEALLDDLYEFRLLVEPKAAALMAENATAAALVELDELVSRMEREADEGRAVPMLETDREFHNLVARASGNRVVAAVSRDIREVLTTLWGFSQLSPDDQREVAPAAPSHRGSDRGGGDMYVAAARAMHDHLEWASESDLRVLGATSPAQA